MGIQRKQNLDRLFDKAFEGLVAPAGGELRVVLSDGTYRQFAYKDHNKDAMNRMVKECKKKGLCVTNLYIAGDARVNKLNDWLRALGGIAGRICVTKNLLSSKYVVYIKPKH